MLVRLRQAQHERLSAPPPTHLSAVPKPGENETVLADKITDSLADIAKKLPPSAIAPVDGLRRAMGIAPVTPGPEPMEVEPITHNPAIVAESALLPQPNASQISTSLLQAASPLPASILSPGRAAPPAIATLLPGTPQPPAIQIAIGLPHGSTAAPPLLNTNESSGVPDLESELREFLESDPTLGHSPLHDDKTLEDILSES